MECLLKEKNFKNVEIKNATFNTIIEKMQNKDIIAYMTEEYIQEELENGNLRKLDLEIESTTIEFGIYYNSNNKLKNVKKIFNSITE